MFKLCDSKIAKSWELFKRDEIGDLDIMEHNFRDFNIYMNNKKSIKRLNKDVILNIYIYLNVYDNISFVISCKYTMLYYKNMWSVMHKYMYKLSTISPNSYTEIITAISLDYYYRNYLYYANDNIYIKICRLESIIFRLDCDTDDININSINWSCRMTYNKKQIKSLQYELLSYSKYPVYKFLKQFQQNSIKNYTTKELYLTIKPDIYYNLYGISKDDHEKIDLLNKWCSYEYNILKITSSSRINDDNIYTYLDNIYIEDQLTYVKYRTVPEFISNILYIY